MTTQKDSAAEQRCPDCGHAFSEWNPVTGRCEAEPLFKDKLCGCKYSFSEAAASEGIPERIKVVVRAATADDWIGVAYCKDYAGDPSTIHEFVRVRSDSPSVDGQLHDVSLQMSAWLKVNPNATATNACAELLRRVESALRVSPVTVDEAAVRRIAEACAVWTFQLEHPLTSETDLRVATDRFAEIITTELASDSGKVEK